MDVQDRLDIIDVQHLYGHVLDRGLWSRLNEVFARDGIFDPSDVGLPPMRGLDEIREKLIPLEEAAGPRRCHHASNILITDLGGGTARVASKYLCQHAAGIMSFGEYHDDMIRTDRGWRIGCRRTVRRALARSDGGAQKFAIDWGALLGAALPRPALGEPRRIDLSPADRIRLLELQHLYGHVLDRGLWDRLGQVFAPDAVFDPSNVGLPALRGLDEIREKLIPLEETGGPTRCHHSTNAILLSADGDRVRMLSKYICSSPGATVSYGEYEDDLVRTHEGWRIACRKTTRRALGYPTDDPSQSFSVDWEALLADAPPRPALAPPLPPAEISLADRLDIEETLARYGHVFDHYWTDRLDQVFTVDGVFDPSSVGLPPTQGIAALRSQFFHESPDHPRDLQRAHHTTNVTVLSAKPDEATVLSKYIVRHERAGVAFGEYEDQLVKTTDGWRIRHRKTFRRALAIDDGQNTTFRIDAQGRRIRDPLQT